jgi:hypothetical protein
VTEIVKQHISGTEREEEEAGRGERGAKSGDKEDKGGTGGSDGHQRAPPNVFRIGLHARAAQATGRLPPPPRAWGRGRGRGRGPRPTTNSFIIGA